MHIQIIMEGRNLNTLQRGDPSLDGGFNIVFERTCPLDMRILDPSILMTVDKEISQVENMNVKILAKGRDTSLNPRHMQSAGQPYSARLENDDQLNDAVQTPKELDFGGQLETAQFHATSSALADTPGGRGK